MPLDESLGLDAMDYGPLKRLLGVTCEPRDLHDSPCPMKDWMWMYADSWRNRLSQVYKHRETRAYLMLDTDGNPYEWDGLTRTYWLRGLSGQQALDLASGRYGPKAARVIAGGVWS